MTVIHDAAPAGAGVLRESGLIAGRTFRRWRAQPGPTVVTLLFPVLVMVMMGGLFGGAIAGSAGDYLPFVVPGVLALTMLFGLESTMTAVAEDARNTVTDRLRSLPIHAASVVLGRCLADLALSAAGLAVTSAAGFALGWRIERGAGAALAAFGLLLLLRFALLWLGVHLGLALPGPQAVPAVQILVWPVGFLSTVFLDPATMPSWLGVIAEWNPLSATADAARQLFGSPALAGDSWPSRHSPTLAVAWPLLLTVVFAPLAARAFRRLHD
jgi:ABC transporter DrrB family efflux protein